MKITVTMSTKEIEVINASSNRILNRLADACGKKREHTDIRQNVTRSVKRGQKYAKASHVVSENGDYSGTIEFKEDFVLESAKLVEKIGERIAAVIPALKGLSDVVRFQGLSIEDEVKEFDQKWDISYDPDLFAREYVEEHGEENGLVMVRQYTKSGRLNRNMSRLYGLGNTFDKSFLLREAAGFNEFTNGYRGKYQDLYIMVLHGEVTIMTYEEFKKNING
jgi:hypothetical protein